MIGVVVALCQKQKCEFGNRGFVS